MMVNNRGLIIHKTKHKKGRRHGYNICRIKENHGNPNQVVNVFDLGYLVVEKELPEQKSSVSNRKRRNQEELSQEEKSTNQTHSRKRMVIGYTIICRMKKYRIIIEDVFKTRLRKV